MLNDKKILAIVPARSGSKGLPGKNIRRLCGKPLMGWPICAALESNYVDRVIVSTDSDEFARVGRSLGAETPFLRPTEFASDTAPTAAVVLHALDWFESRGESFDYVMVLEPTSPLTEAYDIDHALERLEEDRTGAESIVGVAEAEMTHPKYCVHLSDREYIESMDGESLSNLPRRQDLQPAYFFDGTLYISKVSAFKEKKAFYHEKTLAYQVPKWKSYDVDCLTDFICVEAIMKNREELKKLTSH